MPEKDRRQPASGTPLRSEPKVLRGSAAMEATQMFANVGVGAGGIAAVLAVAKSGGKGGGPSTGGTASPPSPQQKKTP